MVTVKGQMPTIQLGEYIIIQRQKYTKMCKFSNLETTVQLGNEKLVLGGILAQPYGATFKMLPKDMKSATNCSNKWQHKKQRLLTLEICNEADLRDLRAAVGVETSGKDNRNILDDGESQKLRSEDIEQLRDTYNDSTKIIENIVKNSKTFSSKTEYSQEKYLKKKEKKYFEFVQILQPSLRLIAEINYRLAPEKILNLRIDMLSQLLSYANVSAFGNFLLYESGTQGLLPASFLNLFDVAGEASLVHMFPGNLPQCQAIDALNLPAECLQQCISVNIYSALREFYQNSSGYIMPATVMNDEVNEPNAELVINDEANEPSKKKLKRDTSTEDNAADAAEAPSAAVTVETKRKWQLENERACKLMHKKFDSLVVAAREHPLSIVRELLPLVKPSRPIVIYSQVKELLVEMYMDLKANAKVTNLHIVSNWMRMYQILPNRTHPEINMDNNNGFLMYGYTVAD